MASETRCGKCGERGCGGYCVDRSRESRWDELRRLIDELEAETKTAKSDGGW
jgi:hypothetical protein